MLSSLKKLRGDKKGWYKVSDLRPGVEIAVPAREGQTLNPNPKGLTFPSDILWDEIVSIKPVGREHVYDIEVEGTHNFVGNGIFAHNTYVLRANTMLAVEGQMNAEAVVVPVGSQTSNASSGSLTSEIPPEVLTADGLGVDLYKLATYNLSVGQAFAAKLAYLTVRMDSLEARMEKLESGAVSTSSGMPSFSTSSLASAFSAVGAYIGNGFAQFGTLIADRFVAASDSAGTSSAGTASIFAGNTVVEVPNAYVAPSTKIFVTFNSAVMGNWYVSNKVNGSFRVILSVPQVEDVSFDYFLVQTEGQMATSTAEQQPTINSQQSTSKADASVGSPTSDVGATTSNLSPITSSDSTPPVVTLVGDAALEVAQGSTFTDPGATATDETDGDLTATIVVTGAVDTSTPGLYSLTYTATDAAGNAANASRVVTVIAGSSGGGSTSPAFVSPELDSGEASPPEPSVGGPAPEPAPAPPAPPAPASADAPVGPPTSDVGAAPETPAPSADTTPADSAPTPST